MKIVVTGIAGYIGSVLGGFLLEEGYKVIGIDKLLYGGRSLLGLFRYDNFIFIKDDIYNVSNYENFIDNETVVINLAAVVGEPASRKMPDETKRTNVDATKKLIDLSCKKNVKHFVFISTCSNYGKVPENEYATEETPLNPLSLYAETKVIMENYLINEVKDEMNWTILRLATVYGISPRPRFDLTVNDFTMHALVDKKLSVYLPYTNRPYIHVIDVSRTIKVVIKNPEKTLRKVFNVGATSENYRKIDIINEIKKIVGDFEIEFVNRGIDPRDYKVSFDKIAKVLNFTVIRKVPDGIKEIAKIVKEGIIKDFSNPEYYNA